MAAIDDILLWFSSPVIALPLTLVLVIVIFAYLFGGKALIDKLLSAARTTTEGAVSNVTRSAASTILKRN